MSFIGCIFTYWCLIFTALLVMLAGFCIEFRLPKLMISATHHFPKAEVIRLLRLTGPILAAQLAATMMSFVDTVMAGQVSATDLAAIATANSIWFPSILLVMGILMALPPLVSRSLGAKRPEKIASDMWQSAWLALLCVLFVMALMTLAPFVLKNMNIEPSLNQLVKNYLQAVMWGAPGFAGYCVLRNTSEGLSFSKPSMWIGIFGLLLNIPLNYIFIHGLFGLPAMGGAGCGLSTAIVYWSMFAGMLLLFLRHAFYRPYQLLSKYEAPQPAAMWHLFKLGFPMGLAFFFEVSLFSVVAILLTQLGATVVAGHQIALNISSIFFMIPMSLGMAVSVRMGHGLGEKNISESFRVLKTGLFLGLSIAVCTALIVALGRYIIADIYTNDEQVIELASKLLLLAAIYQLPDTVQVLGAGALRALKDSRGIFIITLISYWPCGFTIGFVLAFSSFGFGPLGAHGFWVGFCVGLSLAALLISIRLRAFYTKLKQEHAAA